MSLTSSNLINPVVKPTIRTQNGFSSSTRALLAIMQRDLVVDTRQIISLLIQVLLQPLFLLFIFGKILPGIGAAQSNYASLLLPGVVALSIFLTGMQGVALPMTLDLGYAREIDDRLLAPLPVNLVAIEKIIMAMFRALLAGAIIFPLAYLILGEAYQVRSDQLPALIGFMLLVSLLSTTIGMIMGTAIPPEHIGVAFSLILTPLIFTGCLYYPWSSLSMLKWFQILTLFNPLTYASEGLRYAMMPPIHGHFLSTLAPIWTVLGLSVSSIIFFIISLRAFRRRVIS